MTAKTANRLVEEKSPYLLQHAHNPVDWYPWGDEAFERARREDKPIFLSVGYATCHWCHVMEKETFEDTEAASHLNDAFVCIKVDREERPDIDAVYMAACQMLTGGGGWPLTVLLTPDKKPFFAGTYFPKQSRFGRIGIIDLCIKIKEMWISNAEEIGRSADRIRESLSRAFTFEGDGALPDVRLLDQAYFMLEGGFDSRFGGFESAPKFPTPHRLLFLLRCHHHSPQGRALEMVEKTLTAMRMGGIWDHVGFGFHRYSTDRQWLLPHFEKMLYDQALMALAYAEAHQVTRNPFYARTAREICTYVLRDMTDANGGFYSAEDADSEGEEGKFYVWKAGEFRRTAGDDADRWARALNVRQEGNFRDEATGKPAETNILHMTEPFQTVAGWFELSEDQLRQKWSAVRQALFAVREKRVHPLKDDKILTDWNGLMIAALSRCGRVLDAPEYIEAAERGAKFVMTRMRRKDGRLMHRFRQDSVAVTAQAADYAFFIFGLLELYQSTFDTVLLREAIAMQELMTADFWDDGDGGFFLTARDDTDLPVRPKEIYDGALPSANAVSLTNLLTLFRITEAPKWTQLARELGTAFAGTVRKAPTAFTFFLCGLDFVIRPNLELKSVL